MYILGKNKNQKVELKCWAIFSIFVFALFSPIIASATLDLVDDCGATPNTISTTQIQNCLDNPDGEAIHVPAGTFLIDDTLVITTEGLQLSGEGRERSIIKADGGTGFRMLDIGETNGPEVRHVEVSNLTLKGNQYTTAGLSLLIEDTDTNDFSTAASFIRNVRMVDIGNGPGLHVSSWSNTFIGVEIWYSKYGIDLGKSAHANTFISTYLTDIEQFCIRRINDSGRPKNINFFGTVAQKCGNRHAILFGNIAGTSGAVNGVNLVGLYLEHNNETSILIGKNVYGVNISNVTLTGPNPGIKGTMKRVIRSFGQNVKISGVTVTLGNSQVAATSLNEIVRIEGDMASNTVIDGLEMILNSAPPPSSFKAINDISTTKKTTRLNNLLSGPGSPQNIVMAPPGSLYMSESGSLYLKKSGTSTTGWVLVK